MLAPRIFRSIPTRLKLNGPVLSYTKQPLDASDDVFGEAVFTAQVIAEFKNSPLNADGGYNFKWYFDNQEVDPLGSIGSVDIDDNNSTLTLVGLDANDNGKEVYCIATYIFSKNEANAVNNNLKSDVVKLIALDDIFITTQPKDQIVGEGVPAQFTCAARTETGKEVRFQWQLDGSNLVDGSSQRTILDTTFPDVTTVDTPKFEVTSDKGDSFTIEWTKLTTFSDFKVDRTYTIVPNTNITTRMYLVGAGGGGSGHRNITGTYGGAVQGQFTFLRNKTYKLIRGQKGGDGAKYSTDALIPGGFPGGGDSQSNPNTTFNRSGGGGGYTGLFITDVEHSNSIMIAGGGGGSSSDPANGGPGGGVSNSSSVCVSVIDESSYSDSTINNDWFTFRNRWPKRPFYLLKPNTGFGGRLYTPINYTSDPIAFGPIRVKADKGNTNKTSDWFELINMSQYPVGTIVSLDIDTSGSTVYNDVTSSIDLFIKQCNESGYIVKIKTFNNERWANSQNAPIADETVFATPSPGDGDGYDSSNYPGRGGEGGSETAGGDGGTKGNSASQGQDGSELKGGRGSNGGGGGAGYYGGGGGSEIGPGAGGGGSSYFDSDLVSSAGYSRSNSSQENFNWEKNGSVKINFLAADYEVTNPEPVYKTITTEILGARTPEMTITSNDSDFGGSVRCELTADDVRQSPIYTDTVAYDVKKARSLVVFEAYDVNNNLQTLSSDLDEGKLTLTSETFGAEYNIITFFSKEKDFNLRLKIRAAAGADKKSFIGGQGGMSIIDLRARKDVEYVVLGLSNNSAVFVYEKSKLIACVGQGGSAGNEGNGGDGGGVNVSGKNGFGNRGGIAGERPVPGSLTETAIYGSSMLGSNITLYPGDTIANDIFGGRTISCSRGRYWIDEGISPCDDNSSTDIQYRGINGNIVSGSSFLSRGFKPGYTVINTAGAANGNASGIGGNGATGGDGGANKSGGGGGSGYTDGTTVVTATRSGGNTEKVSTIEFSVTDTPGVDPQDPDFRD